MSEEIIKTFILAMLPIGELRVALPVALTQFKMSLPLAYSVSVIGNLIPVVFIVLLLEPVSKFLSEKNKFFRWFFKWLFEHTRKRHSHRFEVLEEIALVMFVAIPLPMTGAWSGALASFVFGIPPKKAFLLIALGVILAGIIVSIVTLGIVNFL